MAAPTVKEGWLRKNHKSGSWEAHNSRRWFVSDGFQVFYYEDNTKLSVRGHFDLRNVVSIQKSLSPTAPSAVDIEIAQQSRSRRTKRIIISFATDADEEAAWLRLWTSAVLPEYVGSSLTSSIDPTLHAQFNAQHADQPACSAKLNKFKRNYSRTKVLTPRLSSGEQLEQLDSGYDTPRETPRERPAADQPAPPSPTPAADDARKESSARPGEVDVADEEDVTFEVTVPVGVKPGDKLQATTPSGVKVKLMVPEKAEPGMSLTFTLPKGGTPNKPEPPNQKAAIAIQSHMRGMKARKDATKEDEDKPSAQPSGGGDATRDQEKAAIALQSTFRGHTVRNEQQEKSRVQWMEYYKQPHVADFEKALDLAVTPEEEASINEARNVWADEEARRIKWFKHYLDSGNLKEAAKLVVTPHEEARLIMAQLSASKGPCACMVGESKQTLEERRKEKFQAAIKQYDWDAAETLAVAEDEIQDVEDSKLRVELMMAAKNQGDFDKAQAYAITAAEREEIDLFRGEVESVLKTPTQEQEAAVAKVQARVRGSMVRGEQEKQKLEKASVVVQKSYRAFKEGDNEQEQRRLTWMQYHLDQGEFDQALDLAVSKAERQKILEAKTKAESPDLCSCLSQIKQRPPGRKEKFIAAIRNYDWDAAQLLAVGDEERQDLEDSKNRVAWMLHYTADGKKEEALALAITDEEKAEIESKG